MQCWLLESRIPNHFKELHCSNISNKLQNLYKHDWIEILMISLFGKIIIIFTFQISCQTFGNPRYFKPFDFTLINWKKMFEICYCILFYFQMTANERKTMMLIIEQILEICNPNEVLQYLGAKQVEFTQRFFKNNLNFSFI